MSAEDSQLIDNEKNDNSNMNRDFIKTYHQYGAQIDDENQNIQFFFGGKPN